MLKSLESGTFDWDNIRQTADKIRRFAVSKCEKKPKAKIIIRFGDGTGYTLDKDGNIVGEGLLSVPRTYKLKCSGFIPPQLPRKEGVNPTVYWL